MLQPHSASRSCSSARRACAFTALLAASLLASHGHLAAQGSSRFSSPGDAETFEPSVYTRQDARVFEFTIPAPRGQITDRHGKPLAVNRLGYNLEVRFPTGRKFTNAEAINFVRRELLQLRSLAGLEIRMPERIVVEHFKNRPQLPLMLARDVDEEKIKLIQKNKPPYLNIVPVYFRTYPHGHTAAHVIGYVGLSRSRVLGPIEAQEPLWSKGEGREGIEKAFDQLLAGVDGRLKITTDETGRITSEGITQLPHPGFNVVTTLDLDLQKKAEETLAANAKRGAIVVMDPNSGDVLALASWPSYDLNLWVPTIKTEQFLALKDDKDKPLLPRAFRSAYPPGSTFKIITGIAAFENGIITEDSYFGCPPGISVGKHYFRNHKETDQGSMDFAAALAASCNTWFYTVGMKTRGERVSEWAVKLGLGAPSGLPITGESAGRVPTNEYMLKNHGRKILDGDSANISIGQGDLLVTPLQMAQAMCGVANGDVLYQARMVLQVQTIDDKVEIPYRARARTALGMSPETKDIVHRAMLKVTEGGTGRRGQVKGFEVAGKTGTAQWGPEDLKQRIAWFTGFAPMDNPQYAFCAMYEGAPHEKVAGGAKAAPLAQEVLEFALSRPLKALPVRPADRTSEPDAEEVAAATPIEDEPEIVALPSPDSMPEPGARVIPIAPDEDEISRRAEAEAEAARERERQVNEQREREQDRERAARRNRRDRNERGGPVNPRREREERESPPTVRRAVPVESAIPEPAIAPQMREDILEVPRAEPVDSGSGVPPAVLPDGTPIPRAVPVEG